MDRSRRPHDPFAAAEAVFSKAAPKAAPAPAPSKSAIPGARQSVTRRVDEEVVEHFQADGPGWQDRMAAALRAAAGL